MQNKGAIRLFAILLAVVCLYQLSFTFVTKMVERDAEEYAQGDILKEGAYLDSISSETVYNFIGLRRYSYRECKEKELNMGLDLKGGMNVTLEISVVDVIKSLSNYSKDTTFVKAIALAQQKQKASQQDFVTLFGEAFSEIDPNGKLAAIFSTMSLKDRINYNSSNEEVLDVIKEETEGAITNSFNILRTRIDRFGVSQPNIQRLENSGRILVELPGIKDPERVRKLLQGTASLEFWETYENQEAFQYLSQANTVIKQIQSLEEGEAKDTLAVADEKTEEVATETTEEVAVADTIKDELSLLEELESDTTAANAESVGTGEQWEKQNPLFAKLMPYINRENQLLSGPAVGYAHYKDTAKVNEYLAIDKVKALFPRDLKFYWTVKAMEMGEKKNQDYFQLIAIKASGRDNKAPLDGSVVTNARAEFGQTGSNAEVSMAMNGEGARTWARLTKENIGKSVAIVLDGYVYSYPTVNSEIKGGRSSISGNFTINEAKDLANVLKSGKMPAPARIIEEAIVGPSLGHEAISSGLSSFGIAFLLVLLYMMFYYSSKAGAVADIALIANVFFIFGILASLGAVLTLPGIAGIVLTIGMSVDANVLIYERIREELAAGKGLKLAVADGYKHAYSAIIDANVTTLLTGIILYTFGTGPIKGFAITLIIGILTSLFSAIFITRLIFTRMLDKDKEVSFSTKLTANAFKKLNINFIEKRKVFYVISGLVIVLGIGSLFSRGLNYGVDFKGGRTYVVRFHDDVKTTDVQKQLKAVYDEAPEVKTFGADNQVKITTKYMIESEDPNADDIVEAKLFEGLTSMLGADVTFDQFVSEYKMSSQKVGPTIADDIKVAAVWAILLSLLVMFIYIFIRFKNWQFGLGALAALVHDVLFVLGIYSLLYGFLPFSLEIDQAFIAAILTVVGYSINDTVVVFDRIREYIGIYGKRDRSEIMNKALNSTLSRTFSTSLSTFVVLLAIFIFGGEVIRGFVFALMIGVVVGTYSSLFIATPVVYDTILKGETIRVLKGRRKE